MSNVCILVLATIALVSGQSQYTPKASLYSSTGCSGAFISLPTSSYANDLSTYGFDNRAYSIGLTGAWLLYDSKDFNTAGNAAMEYIFEPAYTCVNFNGLGGYVSSAKFVGSNTDYRTDTITFYDDTYFQGFEEYVVNDLPNLSLSGAIASLVITGRSAWTVYDQANYGGNGICLVPVDSPTYDPAFVPDTVYVEPTIPHGSIRSVRRGCFSQKIASLAAKIMHGASH
jgi:hypothetical protein